MIAQYHNASSQPQFTGNSVKSESCVEFSEFSFALKECNAKPHLPLEGSTWPFFCFWELGDGDSQLHGQKELVPERGSAVPVPIHFTGSQEQCIYPEPPICNSFWIQNFREQETARPEKTGIKLPLMMPLLGNSSPAFSTK